MVTQTGVPPKLNDPITAPPASHARRRYAAGRMVRVPKAVRTVRDMIRKHLSEAGVDQKSLHVAWKCKPQTVNCLMSQATNRRALAPQHVDAVIAFLKLDDFDATELHRQAAREAGFHIDGPSIRKQTHG